MTKSLETVSSTRESPLPSACGDVPARPATPPVSPRGQRGTSGPLEVPAQACLHDDPTPNRSFLRELSGGIGDSASRTHLASLGHRVGAGSRHGVTQCGCGSEPRAPKDFFLREPSGPSRTHLASLGHRVGAGFTLLELIVAIGVFAVLATMAYGGLRTVLDARNHIQTSLARTADFQKAYWVMRDDFINADARQITNGDGQNEPALLYVPLDQRLSFTRGGWPNPADLPRSTLQRVGYLFDSDKKELLRRIWPVLDRAPQTKPMDTVLLDQVSEAHWRFLDAHGNWHDSWPEGDQTQASVPDDRRDLPPQAVELRFTAEDWGKIRWLFSYGIETGSSRKQLTTPTLPSNVLQAQPGPPLKASPRMHNVPSSQSAGG